MLNKAKRSFATLLVGVVAGAVNGLFGGGGGSVLVPAMEHALGYDAKNSHATAIAVILPVCIASAIIYFLNGKIDQSVAFPASVGASLGAPTGAFLLGKMQNSHLVTLFALITFCMGLKLLLI